MVPAPPRLLIERLQQHRCVLFAGAGLSAGANFPSWPTLLSELIDQVHAKKSEIEELRKLLAREEFLDVADFCQRRMGAAAFKRFMVRRFGGRHEVPRVHRAITKLPLAGIVTTNYDKLFELAYDGRLKVRTHADRQLSQLPFDGPPAGPWPFLLKAHGDIDEPKHLILTSEDYAHQIHSNAAIKVAFNWLMLENAILFVGYSLKDPDFKLWLQWYTQIFDPRGDQFALMSDVGPVEREQIRRTIGIEVLSYPKDRHEIVGEFIDALVTAGQPMARSEREAVVVPANEEADKETATRLIARLDSVSFQRAVLLARPSPTEKAALAERYGDTWQEMRRASLEELARSKRPRGNVVVIPDLFESSLTMYESGGSKEIWLNMIRLVTGGIRHLRMRPDGSSEKVIYPTGIIKKWYADLLLSLAADNWRVHPFWYDWRQDFNKSAAGLHAAIKDWFGPEPVCHILAHGAGGMIARAFIKNYPETWNVMLDRKSEIRGLRGGRLLMLGSSQRGSLSIPDLIMGGNMTVRQLAIADIMHNEAAIQAIFNSWPSLYQLLPSPLAIPAFSLFYDAASYGDWPISQEHLDSALRLHASLESVVDPERMSSVFNDEKITPGSPRGLKSRVSEQLDVALAAEPRAANLLAELRATDGTPVPGYYVGAGPGHLPSNPKLTSALNDLLETGITFALRENTDK